MSCAYDAAKALQQLNIFVSVVNARFVKPLDFGLLDGLIERSVITVEDNILAGGFGSAINTYFAGKHKEIKNFAYNDQFIPQGGVMELMEEFGLSAQAIAEYVKSNENR